MKEALLYMIVLSCLNLTAILLTSFPRIEPMTILEGTSLANLLIRRFGLLPLRSLNYTKQRSSSIGMTLYYAQVSSVLLVTMSLLN